MNKPSLPTGWKTVLLGDLAVEGPQNGYSGKTGGDASGTATLRLGATTTGSFILSDTTTKRLYETIPQDARYWLEPGDLLIQRSNTREYVGATAVYDGPKNAFIYPDLMMRLRFEEDATTRWVWRYMNSPRARAFVHRMAGGSAASMPKISGAKIKTLPVPLPPLPEQRRITAILDQADAVRRARREAIGLTEELLRSAFLEMFGDPVVNPRGWSVVPLQQVVPMIQSGWSPSCEPSPAGPDAWGVLKLGAVTTCDYKEEHKALPADTTARPELEVKNGDLLFTRKNTAQLVAAVAYVHSTRARLMFPALIFRLRPDNSIAHPAYLWQCLIHPGKRQQIQALAAGSSGSMPGISKTKLREVGLPIPPRAKQESFAALVTEHFGQRRQQERASGQSDLLFSSLLQRAFRGEL